MKLTIIGCEYAGKTTLGRGIAEWTTRTAGEGRGFHDHFVIPNEELDAESKEHLMTAPPQLKEMFQRFMIAHHLSHDFFVGPDQNFIGFHIEEAVYAPLYYGYGGENSHAEFRSPKGQRTEMARAVEREVMRLAPDAALVLLKAKPEVIRERMGADPHEYQLIRDEDIEQVLERFEEEYDWSLIQNKFVIDTSDRTSEETLDEFLKRFEPYFTAADQSPTWEEDRKEQIDRASGSYL